MCCSSSLSWLRSVRRVRPICSSSTSESGWFASASQRRGVTPLVTLQKRVGKIFAKSANSDCHQVRCSSETPFTLWLITTASQGHAYATTIRFINDRSAAQQASIVRILLLQHLEK